MNLKVLFPRNKAIHKRNYDRELTACFNLNGIAVNWEQMQKIHYAVQEVFDRQDMLNEVAYQLGCEYITPKQASLIHANMDNLVDRYRTMLDEGGVFENWRDTLTYVLEDFLDNKEE